MALLKLAINSGRSARKPRHSGRQSMGDVFICDAVRTPIGRFGGSLAKVRADDLAAAPIKALMARHPTLDWSSVDEVYFGCSDQAAFAIRSQQRAGAAIASGYFAEEITPVSVPGGKAGPVSVDKDEHPRPETTLEGLSKLKPIVRNPGTVTAGNASGVNDGAAAMILASEPAVKKHGLTPRARILGLASAAVPPRIMGIGPVPATRKLMERLGLKISDFDLIELNEAFASQGIACLRQLGVKDDADFVNPHGGAIALGHPLGMSGARLALTAVHGMEKRGGKLALATMCVGVGQGVAMAIEMLN